MKWEQSNIKRFERMICWTDKHDHFVCPGIQQGFGHGVRGWYSIVTNERMKKYYDL